MITVGMNYHVIEGKQTDFEEKFAAVIEALCAADVYGPNTIASTYNEPATLLDLPRQAAQGDVYSFQFPNPEYALPSNTLVEKAHLPVGMSAFWLQPMGRRTGVSVGTGVGSSKSPSFIMRVKVSSSFSPGRTPFSKWALAFS